MEAPGTHLVDGPRRALEAGDWASARSGFETALAAGESAEALDGCGLATWFLGGLDEGVALRERAVAAYAREGDCARAARAAVWVSRQYLISGRTSAAAGWLARAERILERAPRCVGHGWLAVERARRAANVDECAECARAALDLARDHGDDDLEVFALSVLGRAEVADGRVEEGSRKLEEAMAAANAGRIRNPHTLGEAYCNLVIACSAAGEWERAAEWCRHVDDFARSREIPVLLGACRTVHADVLLASGRWSEAEAALLEALDAHRRGYPVMAEAGTATLALLRVRQGRLEEAEELLTGREEATGTLLALAELRLAEGEPRTAAALLERGLAAAGGDRMAEARLLAPLVDAHLAGGDLDRARMAAGRLADLAEGPGRRFPGAQAALAAARVANAEGRAAEARERARVALATFGALAMPLEAAEARLELARALRDELPELAREETRAAREAFRALGAVRSARRAGDRLSALGPGPGARDELTAREREVLDLVARGLTNAAIARTLHISGKTAGHHVSRILAKLGARNRAEAAAHAARLGAAAQAGAAAE